MAIEKRIVKNGLGQEVEALYDTVHKAFVVEHTPVPAAKDEAGNPDALQTIAGVGPEVSAALHGAGLSTLVDVQQASDEQLLNISGIGSAQLKKIRKATA